MVEMENKSAEEIMLTCSKELQDINDLLSHPDSTEPASEYIKKYAVIRASGSIESAFKKIIADKVEIGCHEQIRNFIHRKIRNASYNPRLGTIENMLVDFDVRWKSKFSEKISLENKIVLTESLSKLVSERNSFAHGGSSELSIDLTIKYFNDGFKVIRILDETVHHDFMEAEYEEVENQDDNIDK